MCQNLIFGLHSCIDSHLKSYEIWMATGYGIEPTPGKSAKVAFEGTSMSYLDALKDLNSKFSCKSACIRSIVPAD